jgi:quercetin dioxygenase-like cupin family protein
MITMKGFVAAAALAAFTTPLEAQQAGITSAGVNIARTGMQASTKGPEAYFTGSVRVDPMLAPKEAHRTAAAYVTFEPAARSAWHTHPAGQLLLVTDGVGRVQGWGGPVREMRRGDVVWQVSDEQYRVEPTEASGSRTPPTQGRKLSRPSRISPSTPDGPAP